MAPNRKTRNKEDRKTRRKEDRKEAKAARKAERNPTPDKFESKRPFPRKLAIALLILLFGTAAFEIIVTCFDFLDQNLGTPTTFLIGACGVMVLAVVVSKVSKQPKIKARKMTTKFEVARQNGDIEVPKVVARADGVVRKSLVEREADKSLREKRSDDENDMDMDYDGECVEGVVDVAES